MQFSSKRNKAGLKIRKLVVLCQQIEYFTKAPMNDVMTCCVHALTLTNLHKLANANLFPRSHQVLVWSFCSLFCFVAKLFPSTCQATLL